MAEYRNPALAADVVIFKDDEVLLIERKNEPYGWALPGGFVDYGEATNVAAIRELEEETTLITKHVDLIGVYSEPDRDPRSHVVSVAYVAQCWSGTPTPKDDAVDIGFFSLDKLPVMAFPDHKHMIDKAAWNLMKKLFP